GAQDRHVALLGTLPRLALPWGLAWVFEPRAERLELSIGFLDLAVDQAHALGGDPDMRRRRLGSAGGHLQRLLAQDAKSLGGPNSSNAMRLEDFGETGLVDLSGPGGRGRTFPQREEVLGRQVVGHLQHLRVIAPQLLADPVGQAGALLSEVVGDARPFAQFDDRGIVDRQQSKGPPIGAQAVAQHLRVAAVVLGAGRREAIAKPVELLTALRLT